MSDKVHVHGFPVGPFQSNTWIASEGGSALVVDPGDEAAKAAAYVEKQGLKVEAILLTHAHLDHVGAVAELEELWNVDTYLHPDDRYLIDGLDEACERYGLPPMRRPQRLRDLAGGDVFRAGSLELTAVETPGHSPGHVVFAGPGFVIVGDLIFAGSVGRTDLPGGSTATLLRSIETRILTLPDETALYPGHGPDTTVGEERRSNPFLSPGALL